MPSLVKRVNKPIFIVGSGRSGTSDPAMVKRARQLSDELQNSPQQRDASASVAEKLEAEFNQQLQYSYEPTRKFGEAPKLIARPRKEHEVLNAPADDGKS
jgi:hypothetical protein